VAKVPVVILAGGRGTRLSEETDAVPKPMVTIGGRPILWHIMKTYESYGFCDFVILAGYKAYQIKEFFSNYALHQSDLIVDLTDGSTTVLRNRAEPWIVTILDTGLSTETGGRMLQLKDHLQHDTFFMTYGDGVGDVDILGSLDFHRKSNVLATVTAVRPQGRFGQLDMSGPFVSGFSEKIEGEQAWVSGGFFVLNRQVLELIDGVDTSWEHEPMSMLANNGDLAAFRHEGFWHPMDSLRDRRYLEKLWDEGAAPWKKW